MLLKVSLSEMRAEMDSKSELFDKCDEDHQNFFRLISYLIIIEEELNDKNIISKIPSIRTCLICIINLKKSDNETHLSQKIKTSWFENLPNCIKKLVLSEIECPEITAPPREIKPPAREIKPPATETKSPPVNIRTSPKRPLSKEYEAKQPTPPEHPRKKNSNHDSKLSFLKNLGKRTIHLKNVPNEAEKKSNN